MEFCKKCSGIIIPRNSNGETLFLCNKCGWFKILKCNVELKISNQIDHDEKKGDGIASGKNEFADYDNKCGKCGYGKVQIIDIGCFYSDEDHIIYLKCGKCGYATRIGEIS